MSTSDLDQPYQPSESTKSAESTESTKSTKTAEDMTPATPAVLAAATAEPPGPGDLERPSRAGPLAYLRALAFLIAGAVLFGLLAVDLIDWVSVVLGVLGGVAIYLCVDTLGKARFGPTFDTTMWFSIFWLVLIVALAIIAPLLPLGEYQDTAATLTNPSFTTPDLFSAHPLGTNNFGLDLLARIVYGARVSITVSVIAVLIGMVVGGTIGLLAGYYRGKTDTTVGIGTNALLAFPPLILLLALASVLAPNLRNITLALSILTIPTMIRLSRANTLVFSQREFVLAARAMGAKRRRIMFRELMPNVVIPLMSYAMVLIAVLIVAEASLSFLGLGIQPPEPSWGNMIAEGQGGVMEEHPHIVLVPGAALFFTVFAFNLVGEKARKRWDPSQAQL